MSLNLYATEIQWNTKGGWEGYENILPQKIRIPKHFWENHTIPNSPITEEDWVTDIMDWISETYGFCPSDFKLKWGE